MRDRSQLQVPQRPFPFTRPDLWDQLPEAIRQQCQELCLQLLQTVLENDARLWREYEREDYT
jgi:hypothetical protein